MRHCKWFVLSLSASPQEENIQGFLPYFLEMPFMRRAIPIVLYAFESNLNLLSTATIISTANGSLLVAIEPVSFNDSLNSLPLSNRRDNVEQNVQLIHVDSKAILILSCMVPKVAYLFMN